MRMERSKHNRSRDMSESCAHIGGDTTENSIVKFCGISQREE